MTKKKIVKVESDNNQTQQPKKVFTPTPESKKKAGQFRLIAIILWVLAIGCEVGAIYLLNKPPVNTVVMIVLIVVDCVLAIIGSQLWQKANRLDPASEKDGFKFFIQNQLGLIISIIAFLPLVVLIFTNKDLKGKQKGLIGGIAVVALLIAGYFGIDFHAPSIEQYTEETALVEELMGQNLVYWTKSGTKYHLYSDCYTINRNVTTEIFEGTVAQARELKNITELCKVCEDKARETLYFIIPEKEKQFLVEEIS